MLFDCWTLRCVARRWLDGKYSWSEAVDESFEVGGEPAEMILLARKLFEEMLAKGEMPERIPRGLVSDQYLLELRGKFPDLVQDVHILSARNYLCS